MKFPLLSKNYVIEESENSLENSNNMSAMTKIKSPLESFNFPEPPKEPFPHYSVKNKVNGNLEDYAQPNIFKGTFIVGLKNILYQAP